MNPSWESLVVLASLLATMAAYALFAGADFGGGIWDLLAGRTERGSRPRAAIDASVTPVWEGNQVWIVLGFVLVFTAYPTAFAAIMTSLFVPLSLSLLGILLRGIGFAFRHETDRLRTTQLSGVLFAASSVMAPFFLGVVVGALASGRVRTSTEGNVPSAWLTPTALVSGLLFTVTCAYIGAIYLVGDSHQRGDQEMVGYFSRRAVAAGVGAGMVAAVNVLLLRSNAQYVFNRLITVALPLVIVSVAAGAAALVLLVLHRVWLIRIAGAMAVIGVVAAWGVAQYPYLLPGTLTLAEGSAPVPSLQSELVVMVLAALLVVPSFAYLYWLQQHGQLEVTEPSEELRRAVSAQTTTTGAAPGTSGYRVLSTVVVGMAMVGLARDAFERARRRRK